MPSQLQRVTPARGDMRDHRSPLAVLIVGFGLSLLAGLFLATPPAIRLAANMVVQRDSPVRPAGKYLNVDAGFGSAELTFYGDGRYSYGDDGSVSVEGRYMISGHEMTFVEDGPADAPCLHQPGTYAWELKGSTFRLTNLDDACASRQYDWASGEWIKAQR